MKLPRRSLCLASFALAFTASHLQAAVLVSTLGAGPSNSTTTFNLSVASPLTVGGTENYDVTGVDWSLYTDPGESVTFTLSFYTNSGGNIGSLLSSADPLVVSSNGTSKVESFNFSTPCNLQGSNSYWLMMTANVGSTSGYTFADSPTVSDYGWTVGTTRFVFPDWSMDWNERPEFTVKASAIPEPSTYALFAGVASLGFALWRRRRS